MSGDQLSLYFSDNYRRDALKTKKADPRQQVQNILTSRQQFSTRTDPRFTNAYTFIKSLDATTLNNLEGFLLDFAKYCCEPLDAYINRMSRPEEDSCWVQMYDALQKIRRDPSETLNESNKNNAILYGAAAGFSFMTLPTQERVCQPGPNKVDLGSVAFMLMLGFIVTSLTAYNLYKWHNRKKGIAASNENFLQWLSTTEAALQSVKHIKVTPTP